MPLNTFGRYLYRARPYTPIPLVIYLVCFGRPEPSGFALSVPFILLGEIIRFWGVGHAGSLTRSRRIRAKRLVTGGAFGHIRHPLYLGNFLLTVGFTLMAQPPMPWSLVVIVLLFAFQYGAIAYAEERFLESEYGQDYLDYKRSVPAFYPRLKPYSAGPRQRTDLAMAWRSERSSLIAMALMTLTFIVSYVLRAWR
jgi:hypothetical protein